MSVANPVLVEAWRGDEVESNHRGAFIVVDPAGQTVAQAGDVDRPVFPRSAVKLLQALPLVAHGAADAFALTDAELALACASHNGEPAHVAAAASMLRKAGLDEAALECGTHWPGAEEAARALAAAGGRPGALHNNCSGKHAGFVCLGCLLARGGDRPAREAVRGYVEPGHPVMREVAAALERTTGARLADAAMGTDGCSIPTYAIALRSLALGFARVATGQGLGPDDAQAARRLRRAIAAAPFMVAGTGRFDTEVMARLGEAVCCKVGAEGVYCAALPGRGLGVAVKVDDGATARAAEVVMAALVEAWVELGDDDATFVRGWRDRPLHNWQGRHVGALRATPALLAAARGRRIN